MCLPGAHGEPDGCADVSASTNIQISRQERSEIGTGRDRIGCDIGAELSQGEGRRDDKNAKSRCSVGLVQKPAEQVQRVPDRFAIDDRGRRRHDDADERSDGEADRDGEELGPERILGLSGKAGEIGVVDDERGEIGNR